MKRFQCLFGAIAVAATLFIAIPLHGAPQDRGGVDPRPDRPHPDRAGRVDIALLLDTSNSMDGLINQAKGQLWAIVQQFAHARKDGHHPTLRVALFEYGNTNLPATEGYLRQVVPLTDDLDKLSAALFALSTQGGDEYCGQVIDEAITRLDWSKADGGYKAIFIAGNEPFTQGGVDYRSACARAIGQGVIVNTIHCGPRLDGLAGQWEDGARLGRGQFFNIDQDRRLPDIPCPQDRRLGELNRTLNDTYLWFGDRERRDELKQNQAAQDANAEAMGGQAAAQRAAVKGGNAYANSGRDLVDTYEQDPAILEKVKVEDLPEEMQKMTPEERKAHLDAKAAERAQLRAEIGKLAAEREAFLAEELKKQAAGGAGGVGGEAAPTLGEAVVEAVNNQLREAGYDVPE
jgi:hypothetical protein